MIAAVGSTGKVDTIPGTSTASPTSPAAAEGPTLRSSEEEPTQEEEDEEEKTLGMRNEGSYSGTNCDVGSTLNCFIH